MRLSLVATLRRHRAIVAALSAAVLAAVPAHAQASAAQPAKTTAPKAAVAQPATATAAKPATAKPAMAAPATATQKPAAAKKVVYDLNTASEADLKSLPGVGDAYAAKIVAGRPYTNKSQLVSKKIIPQSLYKSISGMVIAKKK